MVRRTRGPGTIIKNTLAAWGISSHSGCGCSDLANEMDSLGATAVESRLEEFTKRMSDSIKQWRSGVRRLIPQPPLFIIEELIRYGISKSREKDQDLS